MFARPSSGGSSAPTTMREATGLAYMHRERARFKAGTSALLGVTLEPAPGEGFLIDLTAVDDLSRITVTSAGTSIGAFAAVPAVAEAAPEIVPAGASLATVRLRLSLLDAKVTVAGLGRTRTAAIDALVLAAHECPLSIDVPPLRAGIGFADRRRVIKDGDASFALGVSVALRISALRRFENVRIVIDLNGELSRATQGEAKLEKQRFDPGFFPEAARLSAGAVNAVDARSSAAARSVIPLVMAALRDAAADALPKDADLPPRTRPQR